MNQLIILFGHMMEVVGKASSMATQEFINLVYQPLLAIIDLRPNPNGIRERLVELCLKLDQIPKSMIISELLTFFSCAVFPILRVGERKKTQTRSGLFLKGYLGIQVIIEKRLLFIGNRMLFGLPLTTILKISKLNVV